MKFKQSHFLFQRIIEWHTIRKNLYYLYVTDIFDFILRFLPDAIFLNIFVSASLIVRSLLVL